MAKAITSRQVTEIMEKALNEAFKEEYAKYRPNPFIGYRLEQCGKQWRVMHHMMGNKEAKTDWMPYEEAEALRKLFEASTS